MNCIMVGGGVIGLLTAYELAQEGMAVTVIEQGRLGGESSWAGGGILSPLYPWESPKACRPLVSWSQAQWPQLAGRLHQISGIDPEFERSGLLIFDQPEWPAAERWSSKTGGNLVPAPPGRSDVLKDRPAQRRALWLPDISQVRNPRLIKSLSAACRSAGVVLREHTRVERIVTGDSTVKGVKLADDVVPADIVVIAAGAWTGLFLEQPAEIIYPVRGQMLLVKGRPGLLASIVLENGTYLIPRRDGRILIGSTVEPVGFDKSLTAEAQEQLLAATRRMVPAVAALPVERQWAGLRPATASGVPIIGQHPEIKGLYVNSGHFRNGFTMAPASARLLVDLILSRPPLTDPAPFRLPALARAELN